MENKKPEFAFSEHSVISLVTEMRAYFQDLKSYYHIAKGDMVSRFDKVMDDATNEALPEELSQVNEKIALFTVLADSLSIADTILHTEVMIAEFSLKNQS